MKFMNIASGSSGNCTLVGSEEKMILVDAGITKKRIIEGLRSADYDIRDITGIFITHEHIDHIRALGVISRNNAIPIYATAATCNEIMHTSALGEFDYSLLNPIEPELPAYIGDLKIVAHPIWHDAYDPVCYTIENCGKKVSIATDLGDYDEVLVESLKDADVMLIEANHDIRMLEVGPYPYPLKQRILSRNGHLSNEAGGRLVNSLLNNHIKKVYLGHLSKENNYPDLAYETVKLELMDNPYSTDVRDFNLSVAKRDEVDEFIEF